MEIGETLYVTTREEWQKWLAEHHREKQQVYLVFYRKDTGQPSIRYSDAVEEAICFGWIDSHVKSMDEERFVRRFTPRRAGSRWS